MVTGLHAAPYGDITFFVVSDLHYGYAGMQAANQATIGTTTSHTDRAET
jgi:hypothetical protein